MVPTFLTYSYLRWILEKKVLGWSIYQCFSTGKDDLYIQFINKKKIITWNIKFAEGIAYHFIIDNEFQKGKNAVTQFKGIVGKRLDSIEHLFFDRSIRLHLDNHYTLWLKGFGKLSNAVVFNQMGEVESIFRLGLKGDWELKLSHIHQPKSSTNNNSYNYRSEIYNFIENHKGYIQWQKKEIEIFINHLTTEEDTSILSQTIHRLFTETGEKLWFEIEHKYQNFLSNLFFEKKKGYLLKTIQNSITQSKKQLEKKENELIEIKNRRSYKELGDLIMANVHAISGGISSVFLSDFIHGGSVRIKLNANISPIKNAENYYRKARNEGMELQYLQNSIELIKKDLKELQAKYWTIEQASNSKELRITEKVKSKPRLNSDEKKPYRKVIFNGFEIWIGKNAKSNEEVLRMAHKNDLWLHARGVAGSHVIIRRSSAHFPQRVIEQGAHLAAYYSKARNQSLVPVDYTFRKFVFKVKGGSLGEVKLMEEKTLLVKPSAE